MNLDHGYHGGLYDGGYHEQDNVKGIIGTGGKSCKILNFYIVFNLIASIVTLIHLQFCLSECLHNSVTSSNVITFHFFSHFFFFCWQEELVKAPD